MAIKTDKSKERNVVQRETQDAAGAGAQQQPQQQQREALRPPVDIREDEERIVLQMDMPGVARDRLSIKAQHDSLVVEGTAQIDMPQEMEPLYADVRSTQYRRSFVLSRDLDPDRIDASLRDGVLTLAIPKREEAKPRRIAVRAE
jgi:HSP20 family molecular chaperone IbpA